MPPITSHTAPTSVDTVARPQSIASARVIGKPSITEDSTTTLPEPYASAGEGASGPPISSKVTGFSPAVTASAASSGKSCAASERQSAR